MPAELFTLRHEQLHAETDAEERPAGLRQLPQHLDQPLPPERRHRIAECPDPGEDNRVARAELLRV